MYINLFYNKINYTKKFLQLLKAYDIVKVL